MSALIPPACLSSIGTSFLQGDLSVMNSGCSGSYFLTHDLSNRRSNSFAGLYLSLIYHLWVSPLEVQRQVDQSDHHRHLDQRSDNSGKHQQQPLLSPEQSQLGSSPVIHPLTIAAAQPTPGSTSSAPAGQFSAQAPHSMQRSLLAMRALWSSKVNTRWGQTSVHLPQPIHFSGSRLRVTTSLRYASVIRFLQ